MKDYRIYIDRKGRIAKSRKISVSKVVVTVVIFLVILITVVYGSKIVNSVKQENKLSKVGGKTPKAFTNNTINYTNIGEQNTNVSTLENDENKENVGETNANTDNTVKDDTNTIQNNNTNIAIASKNDIKVNAIKDTSVADKELPKTGEGISIIPIICIIFIVAINIICIRYKQ